MSTNKASGMVFSKALAGQLSGMFGKLIEELRESQKNQTSKGDAHIQETIRTLGHSNFTIGYEGLKEIHPGEPWPPAVVSDLAAIIANHFRTIFFIGKDRGVKEELLGRELLLGVLLRATGEPGGWRVLQNQGETLYFHRPGSQELQDLISRFAEATNRLFGLVGALRSTPESAPAIISAWGFLSTCEIGELARTVFSSKVQERPAGDSGSIPAGPSTKENATTCDLEKVKILINLLKTAHEAEDRKSAIMAPFLAELGLPPEENHRIERRMVETKPFPVDYLPFQREPWRKLDLLMDLIGFTWIDPKQIVIKTQFVKDVGRTLGFSPEDMDWLLEEEARAKAFRGRSLLP